jgi:predicted HicB family RNase H-like nuclease
MTDTKSAKIAMRVLPKLKSALETLAAREKRTLSQYIEIVLEDHIAAQKAKR